MELNSNLPVLVSAVVALIVASGAAGLALAWNRRPEVRRLVSRAWIGAVVVILGGAGVFWLSTAMVEGPRRATVDRGFQKQQQQELNQRLQQGGH